MTIAPPLTFARLLRDHRLAADLTQEELAERARLSVRGISDLERGVKIMPHRDTVDLLAEALELSDYERAALAATIPKRRGPVPPPLSSRGFSASAPPLVGRVRELESLKRHLAGEGPPILLLTSEPGMGKTRLLQEATHLAANAGITLVEGGCQRQRGQEPYAPLLEALADRVHHLPPARLRSLVARCPWLVLILPELTEFLQTPLLSLPPDQERRLLFTAVVSFLSWIAGRQGMLLVLDDLQWAGIDALDLFLTLARSASDIPLRIIGAYRQTELEAQGPLAQTLADLAQAGLVTQLTVGPLDSDEAAELLQELLAEQDAITVETGRRILDRTGGVPFFLVSYIQGLSTGGRNGNVPEDVPLNLAHALRQRIAAVSEDAREMLQVASVAGGVVPRSLLLDIVNQPEERAMAALEATKQARLLREYGEDAYQFAHELVREMVEADLGRARCTALHRRIAQALERLPGAQHVEAVAEHYGQAGDWEKALPYLEQAGDRAQTVHAHAAAERYYRPLVERLDAIGANLQAAQVRTKLGAALLLLARYDEALEILNEAARVHRVAGDLESEGRDVALLGRLYYMRGTAEEGIERIQEHLAYAEERGPSPALATLYVAQANLLWGRRRLEEQLEVAERAAAMARILGDDRTLVEANLWKGIALLAMCRPAEGMPVLKALAPLAERVGDLTSLARGLNAVAVEYEESGEFEKARPYLERAVSIAEQLGDPALIAFLLHRSAEYVFRLGDWVKARQRHERAVALLRQVGTSWSAPYAVVGLGSLLLAQGERELGRKYMEDGISLSEQIGNAREARMAHVILATWDLLEGRPDEALHRLRRAGGESDAPSDWGLGDLPIVAEVYLALGDHWVAEKLAGEAIEQAISSNDQLMLMDGLRVQAMVAAHKGRWQEAESALDEASALARSAGHVYATGYILYTYRVLATAAPERARGHLEAALGIFRRLGARPYIERTERVLAELSTRGSPQKV